MIHDQKTVYGSWVTSIWLMEDLVERIVRWRIHPEDLVTNRFPLEKADEAYALMASGKSGKVAVVFDEESEKGAPPCCRFWAPLMLAYRSSAS